MSGGPHNRIGLHHKKMDLQNRVGLQSRMGPQQGLLQLLGGALCYEDDEALKQHLAFKRHQAKIF